MPRREISKKVFNFAKQFEILLRGMRNFLLSLVGLLLVIVLSFGTIKPLFLPGFFLMHDDTQPSRIDQMTKSLSSGQFPVRFVGDLGYGFGYPLFNFYAPLPYYIGAFFNIAGFDALAAAKLMFMIGIVLAGLTMFVLVKEIGGNWAALTSSILYMYAPYHAVDIYVRGAVGEFYALAFLPLILLGIVKIFSPKKQIKNGILIGSFGYAAVLLSHNILGMISSYFLIGGLIIYFLYLTVCKKRLSTFYFLLSTLILGLGLSAFFTLPAVVEKKYTKVEELTGGGSDFHNHFVYLDQLWNSSWGFGGSAEGRADGMSFKIGKLHLLLATLSIALSIYLCKRKKINKFLLSVICYLLSVFLISVFLMLEPSRFIWEILPGFSYVQYPWRFLSFTIFSLSFIVFVVFIPFKKLTKTALSILIIGITIWLNIKYFSPKEFLPLKPQDYTSSENLRFKISKISDEYLPKEFIAPQNISQIVYSGITENPDIRVVSKSENPTEKKYYLDIKSKTNLLTNIAFFPGWQGMIDNNAVTIGNNSGRIEVEVPSGVHLLSLKLLNTPVRTLANAISIFALFLLLYVAFIPKRKTYE